MNLYLLLLLIPPIIVTLGFKIFAHAHVTVKEAVVQGIAAIAVVCVVWSMSTYSMGADTEIWNGKVTGKERLAARMTMNVIVSIRQLVQVKIK